MLRQNANRQRAARKKIRVIFPDCTVICHKKVTLTMVDTLRHIGVERFTDIDLMVGDQRWVTTEVPQRYKDLERAYCRWLVSHHSEHYRTEVHAVEGHQYQTQSRFED